MQLHVDCYYICYVLSFYFLVRWRLRRSLCRRAILSPDPLRRPTIDRVSVFIMAIVMAIVALPLAGPASYLMVNIVQAIAIFVASLLPR